MAVVQSSKKKVRPVLDFRELNKYVAYHTRDGINVCEEVMREWRRMERASKIVDLKSAYLQIHVDKKLWWYELVEYKDQIYCLTRLRFGLTSAPNIMTAVLKIVLTKDDVVERATNPYIDDVQEEEAEVTVEKLRDHVNTYRLTAKPSESLENGMALGLMLWRAKVEKLMLRRGNKIPEVMDGLNKWELFLVCRKLVGHYFIVGWLQTVYSFIKRQTRTDQWEDKIDPVVLHMIQEVIVEVRKEGSCKGRMEHKEEPERGNMVWC